MKVFISWSGPRSKAVAELLNNWLKRVLQATDPWVSSEGIDRGERWLNAINDNLNAAACGIVCLTADNKDKPWIHYESGALSKGLGKVRVCTFLIDLSPTSVDGPLAQYNHTIPTEEEVFKLIKSLNDQLDNSKLNDGLLKDTFDTFWPRFKKRFEEIIAEAPTAEPATRRNDSELLDEILSTTRSISQRLAELESEKHAPQNTSSAYGAGLSGFDFDPARLSKAYEYLGGKSGFAEAMATALKKSKEQVYFTNPNEPKVDPPGLGAHLIKDMGDSKQPE